MDQGSRAAARFSFALTVHGWLLGFECAALMGVLCCCALERQPEVSEMHVHLNCTIAAFARRFSNND
eukprot:1750876-Pyramimonas_sp.AAC.1